MGVQDGVSGWSDLLPRPRAILQAARGLAAWMEKSLPWPLDLGPRLSRWSLDVALGGTADGKQTERGGGAPSGRTAAAPGVRAATAGAARAAAPRAGAGERRDEPPARRRETARPAAEPSARGTGIATSGGGDREVAARGAPLYVRDAGAGPAVLLLHAFPLSGRMWEPQIEALRDRYRIIAPDLPGFGLTWSGEDTASLDDYAAAVVASLDQLGVRDVVVVGLSMGGYVAFRLVERLGSRMRGLVLADTRATPDDEATVAGRHELAAEVEAEGVGPLADAMLPRLLGATTQVEAPELLDRVRALILANHVPGVAAALRAMAARKDSTALLERIACPVMCIVGDEDALTPPEAALAMASRLRDASVEVLPRVGHLASLEAAPEFNALLAGFLGRIYGV